MGKLAAQPRKSSHAATRSPAGAPERRAKKTHGSFGQCRDVTATQNIAEFWNLCTRPAVSRGGIGLRLTVPERFITVVKEPDSAYREWKEIVVAHKVLGKQSMMPDSRLS